MEKTFLQVKKKIKYPFSHIQKLIPLKVVGIDENPKQNNRKWIKCRKTLKGFLDLEKIKIIKKRLRTTIKKFLQITKLKAFRISSV
jgi:hypothetical protein